MQMWSYYGGGQKGICLELDMTPHEEYLTKVKYVQCVAELSSLPIVDRLRFKLSTWSHEQEYRVLRFKQPRKLRKFQIGKLTSIIFGAHIDSVRRASLRALAESRTPVPEFYQAKLRPHDYGLDFVRI